MRLSVFLKHDQTKNLAQIDEILCRNEFWSHFPPEGVQVVAWNVMMGLGQVIILELPEDKLRAVNLVLEQRAWGAFSTEIYATYDFSAVVPKKLQQEKDYHARTR
jgi:hypothetical protein